MAERKLQARRVSQKQERLVLSITLVGALVLAGTMAMYNQSCRAPGSQPHPRNELSRMARGSLTVKGKALEVWVARTAEQRELGLMGVKPEEVTDNQGMLFVFDGDQGGGFWMKDTIIPLDIAFIRHDGTVVDIQQMEPFSLVSHSPPEPYRYALEVKAGVLGQTGLEVGDVVSIPAPLLNLAS